MWKETESGSSFSSRFEEMIPRRCDERNYSIRIGDDRIIRR